MTTRDEWPHDHPGCAPFLWTHPGPLICPAPSQRAAAIPYASHTPFMCPSPSHNLTHAPRPPPTCLSPWLLAVPLPSHSPCHRRPRLPPVLCPCPQATPTPPTGFGPPPPRYVPPTLTCCPPTLTCHLPSLSARPLRPCAPSSHLLIVWPVADSEGLCIGKFEQAVNDYFAAVSLKIELLPLPSHQVAEGRYKLCIVYDLTPGRLAHTIEHAQKSKASVQARLDKITTRLPSA